MGIKGRKNGFDRRLMNDNRADLTFANNVSHLLSPAWNNNIKFIWNLQEEIGGSLKKALH
jgi:hypothetical protein